MPAAPRPSRAIQAAWAIAGLTLLSLTVAVALLSSHFQYGGDKLARPLPLLVAVSVVAGLVYLGAAMLARRTPDRSGILPWIVAIGLAMRATLFFSTPICETDFYRYLWDGGVVATGFNPFAYTPDEVAKGEARVPEELVELGQQAGQTLERVNHETLGTIYPTMAQAAFALAHLLRPWSLGALRVVFFLFDAATLVLIALLLRRLRMPMALCAVYWWNPLLVKETVNSAHMDVVVLPFVMGALLLTLRERRIAAAIVLALAVGAKLWPIVLLPIILRPLFAKPARLGAALAAFALVLAVLFIPMLAAMELRGDSGFAAYGERWEMNDALFMVFMKASQVMPKVFGIVPSQAQARVTARAIVVALLLTVIALRVWRSDRTPGDTCTSALIVIASLFLLSPTQFPWYFLWLVPFLALRPSYGLLALTVTLPLYYLRFYYEARDNVGFFDSGVVWIEFAPIWGLMLVEWGLRRRRTRKESRHA